MGNQNQRVEIQSQRIVQVNVNTQYARLPRQSTDSEFIDSINDLRKSGTFCDVVIKVQDKTFKAHKVVLAAVSGVFKDHFVRSGASEIELDDGIPSVIFEMALDWVYGESVLVPITPGDYRLTALMLLAKQMRAPSLQNVCGILMSEILDQDNCFLFYETGKDFDLDILRKAAKEFIQKNFKTLCQKEEFLKMSPENLKDLISDGFFERNFELVKTASEKWLANRKKGGGLLSFSQEEVLRIMLRFVLQQKISSSDNDDSEGNNTTIHVMQCLPEQNTEGIVLMGEVGKQITVTGLLSIEKERLYILAPPPFQLSNLRLTSSGKYIYMQTVDKLAKQADLWCYKGSSNQWRVINSGQAKIIAEALFQLGDELYVFGADGQNRTVWKYSPSDRVWTSLPALRLGVHNPLTVSVNGMIYILGEEEFNSDTYTFQRYDPQTGNTKLLDKFPVSVYIVHICPYENNIFAVDGGKPDEPGDPDIVYMYNTSMEKWVRLSSPLHKMRKRPVALVVLGGVLTLVSIETSQTVICQQYSPSTQTWKLSSKTISVEPLSASLTSVSTSFVFRA